MTQSRKEARRAEEFVRGTPEEIEGLERIRARIKENAEVVFSLRFTPSEMSLLRAAAAARGVTLSELVRSGALAQAREAPDGPSERDVALREARQFVQAAARALDRA